MRPPKFVARALHLAITMSRFFPDISQIWKEEEKSVDSFFVQPRFCTTMFVPHPPFQRPCRERMLHRCLPILMEQVLNYLPRADISPMVLDRQKYIEESAQSIFSVEVQVVSWGNLRVFKIFRFINFPAIQMFEKKKFGEIQRFESSVFRCTSVQHGIFMEFHVSSG